MNELPLLDDPTDRGGVVVRRPDELAGEHQFVFRTRWTASVHNHGHTTHYISTNPELDADVVSFAPFGGETRRYRIAERSRIPADEDGPSPDVTLPIEVEDDE